MFLACVPGWSVGGSVGGVVTALSLTEGSECTAHWWRPNSVAAMLHPSREGPATFSCATQVHL